MARLEITRRTHNTLRTVGAAACILLAAVTIGAPPRAAAAADSQPLLQLAYAVPGPANAAGIRATHAPFAQSAFRTVDAGLFPKWHAAIARTNLQLSGTAAIGPRETQRARDAFKRIVEQVTAKSGFDMLVAANALINTVPYRADQEVYGTSDYWATPVEMLTMDGGDCEDRAIAKIVALKQAGVSEDALRLVVGIDTATGKPHAMAVAELDGVAYALDGRTNRIAIWGGTEMRFRPLYAAGFQKVWIYRS